MQLNIFDFLQKLESEGGILPRIREMLQAEIEKYLGMRLVLESADQNKEFASNLLASIDAYLENLRNVQLKFNLTFLALLKTGPNEDPEINKQVLNILRKINQRHKVK
jgi:hypothetical protein